MRVLCSSVLVFEMIVIGLFVPVGILVAGYPAAFVGTLGAVVAALAFVACAGISRGWGLPLGWLVQVAMVAAGFIVPMMLILGALFGALWWAAIHFGMKADAIRAQQSLTA